MFDELCRTVDRQEQDWAACMCVSDFMCVVVHFICICLSTDVDELTPYRNLEPNNMSFSDTR